MTNNLKNCDWLGIPELIDDKRYSTLRMTIWLYSHKKLFSQSENGYMVMSLAWALL